MNKSPLILYISFFPILLLIALAGSAGYFLLKDDIKLPSLNKTPEVRRLEGFPTVVNVDAQIEKQRRVIRSQEELQDFLTTADPSGNLVLGEKINFDREYLLGVSNETEEYLDTEMKVRKLYEDKEDKSLLVVIRRLVLPSECEPVQQKNVAVDIVAVTKTDFKIEFDVVKENAKKCTE